MLSIVAKNLRVESPLYDAYQRSLRHQLGLAQIANSLGRGKADGRAVGGKIDLGRAGRMVIKALNGVSFELHEGDRRGILGHNGAGKTTLLRMIAGIYEPIDGELTIHGRVTPLFDVQLGMDPDATGIENIWPRGRMLDLNADQIRNSLNDIAGFTELGDYLSMPIRTYSAGMKMRLAFAVSTAIEFEILVLDKMIEAGDAAFIEQAHDRLKSFVEKSGILVIASHNVETLGQWCNKEMFLERGGVVAMGPLEEVIARYQG